MSNPINTEYGMRPVTDEELIAAFGTLRHAKNVARGDEATRLYFLHNRDRIPPNDDLIKVLAAWEAAPMHNGRKYISEVSELSGVALSITKEILIERGLHVPRAKVSGGPVLGNTALWSEYETEPGSNEHWQHDRLDGAR